MEWIIIVRIAIWLTFFLLIIDSILLTALVPKEIHFLKKEVKEIKDILRSNGLSK